MKTTIKTKWGTDMVSVSADWGQASCPVEGDDHGRQVADFRHSPEAALRAALLDFAHADGMPEDEIPAAIEEAMSDAQEIPTPER